MPMRTQLIRDGEPVSLRWGLWHVQSIGAAIAIEKGVEDPFADHCKGAWDHSREDHTFARQWICEDPADGEVMVIEPGDQYHVSF